MARSGGTLTRADLQLLHEALAYMRKRSFQQADSIRLQGILERVEELLLDSTRGALRFSPPEQEVLEREIPIYCEALTQRGGSVQGAHEAQRLLNILEIIRGRRAWWRRLWRP